MTTEAVEAFKADCAWFSAAARHLEDAWREFGAAVRRGREVEHQRRLRTDPTYVPYRFESAEARAERRRNLHGRVS